MNEHLDRSKAKFGTAPRKFPQSIRNYLKLNKPPWLPQVPDDKINLIFEHSDRVLRDGVVVWGRVIQANQQLFEDGEHDCPGEVVYSLDDSRKVDVGFLEQLATKLFSLKGTEPSHEELAPIANYLTDQMIRVYGLDVPRILSPNLNCKISTVFFDRKHLPNQKLCSLWLPIVVSRSAPFVATPLPERFWPRDLKELWCKPDIVRNQSVEQSREHSSELSPEQSAKQGTEQSPEQSPGPSSVPAVEQSNYDTVIKISSWAVAGVTAIVCVIAFIVLSQRPEAEELTRRVSRRGSGRSPLAGLILMPAGGYLLGMAIAVLFAPSSYLTSRQGKKWMRWVGVKTIGKARVVSLIFVLFGIAFLTFFTLAVLTNNFKESLF